MDGAVYRGATRNGAAFLQRMFAIAAVSTVLTVGLEGYILTHQHDGGPLDLHDKIPALAVARHAKFPDEKPADAMALLTAEADGDDKLMRSAGLALSLFSIANCSFWFLRSRHASKIADGIAPRVTEGASVLGL